MGSELSSADAWVRVLERGLVLVADDEPAVREVSRRVLERAGFAVAVAAGGREAVSLYLARKDEFVAVVLDMTMPVLSGDEAFRELRRINPGVPIVLSSGYSEQDATRQFVGKGLAQFLQKPWSPEDLVGAVRAAIDTAPAAEPE